MKMIWLQYALSYITEIKTVDTTLFVVADEAFIDK